MKRFLIKFMLIGIPIIIIVIVPLVSYNTSGDLGMLGLIHFDESYRRDFDYQKADTSQTSYYYSARELLKQKNADILVIGDSFAHTRETACRFQDYLSKKCNINIATLYHNLDIEPLDILVTLLSKNSDQIPKLVIVESVERAFVRRLLEIQFDTVLDLDCIYYKSNRGSQDYIGKTQNFYKKKVGMDRSVVYNVKLNKDLFTCKGSESDLYFYPKDIYEICDYDVSKSIENLELLHNYAMSKGIFLVCMVAADKYDVYQKFIVDNPYKPNDILSEGNRFDSLPYFINTKYVLAEAAEIGMMDIYWADDTHWSPVGAKIVAEEIARKLDSLNVFKDEDIVEK